MEQIKELDTVIELCCKSQGVKPSDLKTKLKPSKFAFTRQICWAVIKDIFKRKYSLSFLGEYVGLKHDHATVLHACKVIRNERETRKYFDGFYVELVKDCRDKLKNSTVV